MLLTRPMLTLPLIDAPAQNPPGHQGAAYSRVHAEADCATGYGIVQPLSGGRCLHVGHLTRPERILLGSRVAVRLPPRAAGLSLRVPLCLRVPYLYCPPSAPSAAPALSLYLAS